jgi:trans-aconitate 2-methyltransferase
MSKWDPAVYARYKAYRDRPALDLMVRLPTGFEPREIWDLGCGTGEHAAVLKKRHPLARVCGLDSSPEMLAEARRRAADIEWILASIDEFEPGSPPDLIFTNAALHWLADHEALFPRLAKTLAAGGVFACQMPQSYDAPWHRLLRETAGDGPWADRLAHVTGVRQVAEPEAYYNMLEPLCGDIDIWSTTYLHVLEGEDPIVDWMKGTGLRPFLEALGQDEQAPFLDAYRRRLAKVFPPRPDETTLFPFPRLFIIARR